MDSIKQTNIKKKVRKNAPKDKKNSRNGTLLQKS